MPIKILLIEDNPDFVLITRRILEKTDMEILFESSEHAGQGVEKIDEGNYDLVLCDYRLPGSSALEILKEMRKKGIDLPFIVVTSSGNEKIAVELMKEGAYDYVVKDFSYESVLPVKIKGAMDRYKSKKERKKIEQTLEESEERYRLLYQKLKETQEELIQSGKMAAMGQLAAGISHELNQPLTGIKGFSQAAAMELGEENPIRKDLDRIIEQVDRMDEIIQSIRFFARKSEFRLREIDINQPIEGAFILVNEQLKLNNIKVRKKLTKGLPGISGDMNQLQQAFINLIVNAKDAVNSLRNSDGGEIIIETMLNEDKKNINVIVEDTGCGISKEKLDYIFNPFFTTKSPDGGMGLGLSIVYRIIGKHNGRIEVESEEGKGATFKIVLPVGTKR